VACVFTDSVRYVKESAEGYVGSGSAKRGRRGGILLVEDNIVSRRRWRVKEVVRGIGCVPQRIEARDLGNYVV
jgi:hypothetical protein